MAGVLSLPLSKVFYGCLSLALSCWKVLHVKVLSSLCLTVEVKSTCSGNALLKKIHASAAVEEYEAKQLEKSVHFRSPWMSWAGPEGAVKAAQ